MRISEETKKDLLDMGQKLLLVAPAMYSIAAIGSSVNTPGWAIPVGTITWGLIGYFARKKDTTRKSKLISAAVWATIAAVFTTASVLAS